MADAKSELYELKRFGARPQPNSGRGKHAKGDGILDNYLVDVKEYSKSFSVTQDVWAKVSTDSHRAGNLEPLLLLVIGEGNKVIRLVVHSSEDFLQMKSRIEELEAQVETLEQVIVDIGFDKDVV